MMKLHILEKRDLWSIPPKAIRIFLMLTGVLWMSSGLNATTCESLSLTFDIKNQSMSVIMKAIEEKSGYTFFYDNTEVETNKKVTLVCNSSSLSNVLSHLFSGTGINYKIVERNIVLSKSNSAKSMKQSTNPPDNTLKITGVITDEAGEPIIGAMVVDVNNRKNGTISNFEGKFELTVSPNSSIEVKSLSYKTQLIQVQGRTSFNIVMALEAKMLEELVVVGYDSQRRANLTGAVGTVDISKQLASRPITDAGRALQGAVPGLTVTTTSGKIGGDPGFKIRGAIGSVNGSSKPLILLDNVEISTVSNINPDDIESISVLKDASSSSIYGSRAAFGVILITSKSAKKGEKSRVNYSTNLSWNRPTVTPEIVSSYDGAELALQAGRRVNPSVTQIINTINIVWNEETIERMREWQRVYGKYNLSDEMVLGRDFEIKDGHMYLYRSFDAPGKFIKDNTFNQQHNLSVNGTSANTAYNLSLGYLGQSGVMKANSDQFDRYNVSFSTNSEVREWLNVRTKLLYSRTVYEEPYSFTSAAYDSWYYLYRWPRIMPYGTYEGIPFRNAVTEAAQANTNTRTNNYLRMNLGTTVKLPYNISLDIDYTFIHTDRLTTTRGGEAKGWDFWTVGQGMTNHVWTAISNNRIQKVTDMSDWHVGNVVGRWKKTFAEDHDFGIIAGSNIEYYSSDGHTSAATNLIDITMPEFNLANGNMTVAGYSGNWTTIGFFGRLNYAYKNKYLLEVNGRYDGSSKFPLDKLWGFFPSASVGYILTEERFMQGLQPWLSFAKLRGSWGQVGNQDVGTHLFRPIMASSSSEWLIDGTVAEKTFGTPRVISDGFTWETITTTNLGLDMRFLNDKFGISADIYQRVNSDMIVSSEKLPASFGASEPRINFGELTNKGYEIAIDFRHRFTNGLNLMAIATLSDQEIKYTKYPTETRLISGVYEGRVYGEIWGFETERFFTHNDFECDANGNLIRQNNGAPILKEGIEDQKYFETNGWFYYGPGDIKYKDLDGSGSIDRGDGTVNNPGDMKVIGNSTPRYEYSFRLGGDWKGFDFNIFFQGVGKRDIWGSGSIVIPGFNYTEAWYTHQLDYWTEENPNAFYPRISNLAQSNDSQNFLPQTKYLLDMSYCRLKNITLGYSLPESVLKKVKLNKLRVYVSCENVFEIDNLGNIPIDPETAVTTGDGSYIGRSYPYVRTGSVGVQLTF